MHSVREGYDLKPIAFFYKHNKRLELEGRFTISSPGSRDDWSKGFFFCSPLVVDGAEFTHSLLVDRADLTHSLPEVYTFTA